MGIPVTANGAPQPSDSRSAPAWHNVANTKSLQMELIASKCLLQKYND